MPDWNLIKVFLSEDMDSIKAKGGIHTYTAIKTDKSIKRFAKAIPLPTNINVKDLISNETECDVTGFGVTSLYSSRNSIVLRKVNVPLVRTQTCETSYPNEIFPTMICAGYEDGGKDACYGDSGGPLSVKNAGRNILLGIVSKGKDCALPTKYGIYTNVQEFIPWIYEEMIKNE